MDNRERVRLFMAHLRQARRAKGICPRCGLARVERGDNCADCNHARRIKRAVVTRLDDRMASA